MRREVLREACDRNFQQAFAALIPHVTQRTGATRSFGAVTAVVTGLPAARFNPVLVTDARAVPEDAVAAVAWVRSLGVPASMQLHEDLWDAFGAIVPALGLEPDRWHEPGMALHPIPAAPPAPSELRIAVAEAETFDDWHAGIAYGPAFRLAYPPSIVDDPVFRFLVGYVDDRPAAGAAAIVTGDVVGVYAVGTAEYARRRGYGRALAWAAIGAGAEAGCDVAVLQSSEMAVDLYRGMGFIEVCRYIELKPPEATTAPLHPAG